MVPLRVDWNFKANGVNVALNWAYPLLDVVEHIRKLANKFDKGASESRLEFQTQRS